MGLLDSIRRTLGAPVAPDAVIPPALQRTPARDGMMSRLTGRARDTLVNLMAGLGGPADRNATSFYAPIIRMNQIEISNAYEGSWLPRKIVDKRVEDMTREGVSVTWKDQSNDPTAVQKLQDAEDRLNGRGIWTEALRWGFAFGGAGIVIGIKGQDLSEPLDVDKVGEGDLEWMMVRDRWYISPAGDWVMDPGPYLGLPQSYLLTNVVASFQAAAVHYTRVIRINGDPLPMNSWLANSRWNDSVLQAPYNAVKRYDAIHGGIGQLIWEAKKDVISVDDLRTMLSYDGGEEELRKRFSAMAMASSLFNVTLLDAKDKYDRKQLSYSGLSDMMREFRTDVAGASGYPITKLFGQSAGGLGSTGDAEDRNYYDDIKGRQNTVMRPGQHLYYRILCRHTFGKEPEELGLKYNPLWQMSDGDRATMELAKAQTAQIYYNIGALAPSVITKKIHADGTYAGALQDDDVALVVKTENTPAPVDDKDDKDEKDDAAKKTGGPAKNEG